MYKSNYEAYSFLRDDPQKNLACDFEILSDEVASKIGNLIANIEEKDLCDELRFVCELTYHLNPTLRTFLSVSDEEFDVLLEKYINIKEKTKSRCKMFVLPVGSKTATLSHIIRNNYKALSRIAYNQERLGRQVPDKLHDFLGLLSNYFFYLSLYLNMQDGIEEIEFKSRNYKL